MSQYKPKIMEEIATVPAHRGQGTEVDDGAETGAAWAIGMRVPRRAAYHDGIVYRSMFFKA
jgi:hypothetical protein